MYRSYIQSTTRPTVWMFHGISHTIIPYHPLTVSNVMLTMMIKYRVYGKSRWLSNFSSRHPNFDRIGYGAQYGSRTGSYQPMRNFTLEKTVTHISNMDHVSAVRSPYYNCGANDGYWQMLAVRVYLIAINIAKNSNAAIRMFWSWWRDEW